MLFFRLVLLMILIFFLHFTFSCKTENIYPTNIPKEAKFDKRKNLYTHVEKGIRKIYTAEGKLYSECQLDDVMREHGICKTFLPNNGRVLSVGRYVHGEKDGEWIWNFPNGNVYYKLHFSHEKKRKVWIETNLLGNEHGPYFRYYENGKLEEEGFYDTGLKTGKWKKFYYKGNLEYEGEYYQDKKILKWKYYYPNGNLEMAEEFTENGNFLLRKTYFPNGKLNCTKQITEEAKCLEE